MTKRWMRRIGLGVCAALSLACMTGGITSLSVSATDGAQAQSGDNYGNLLYSFQVMSDMEINADASYTTPSTNFTKALNAVKTNDPDSKAIFMPGDVTSNGSATEWANWKKIMTDVGGLPTAYPTLGNHDLTPAVGNDSYEVLYQNFLNTNVGVTNNTYYDTWIEGNHFIMLGSEDTGHNAPVYSDAQFEWFEEKLAESASIDKPIFVFSHYTFRNTSAGSYLGSQVGHSVGSEDKLRFMEILKKYPQVIWFTAHTHFGITDPNNYYNVDLENGKGANIIGDSSTHYLCDGDGKDNVGSQFLFVEVYENVVKVRGYDNQNSVFLGDEADRVINIKEKEETTTPVPEIELSTDSVSAGTATDVTAYVTFADDARVEANDGAWVGVVGSNKEGVVSEVLRYAMLKDLERDTNGRYVWKMTDNEKCGDGVCEDWQELLTMNKELYVGVFEDTLYLGQEPYNASYSGWRYDPYARVAKATIAVDGATTISGAGTASDPYIISDASSFAIFSNSLRYGNDTYVGKYVKQTADIDMTGRHLYVSEDADKCFAGVYDGNGYVIKNIAFTSQDDGGYAVYNGIFGVVTGKIINVGVVNSTFNGTYVGSIVRQLLNGGCLINSYSTATVTASGHGAGLCDNMTGNETKLMNCVFMGKSNKAALVGYNSGTPKHDMLYYVTGSTTGVSSGATQKSIEEMKTAAFVQTLNDNRQLAAAECGISADYLCEWEIKDGQLALKPASSNPTGEIEVKNIRAENDGLFLNSTSNSGIRFKTSYNQAYIEELKATYESVSFGTLIIPASYAQEGKSTHAALNGLAVIDVETPTFAGTSKGYCYAYVNLVRIKLTNYQKDFVAIGYIKVKSGNGAYTYIYSEASNAVNLYDLARNANQESYSALQKKIVQSYINAIES